MFGQEMTMSDKSVETLRSKVRFSGALGTFNPTPTMISKKKISNNVHFFSISKTAQTTAHTQHGIWGRLGDYPRINAMCKFDGITMRSRTQFKIQFHPCFVHW